MFFYNAYGLNILSEMYFPELNNDGFGEDVSITFDNIESPHENYKEVEFGVDFKFKVTDKGVFLLLDNVDLCRISQGKEIIINPDTGFDESFLRVFILGPAISILLHQRGNLVLHAGAANINGNAVAFLGDTGSGKSTSLSILYKDGYPVITDDSLQIKFGSGHHPMVIPSYSRLKLHSDVMNYIQGDLGLTPKTHVYSEKYSYSIDDSFSHEQLPLKKIYIIEKADNWDLNLLNPNESLLKLVKSSYCYGIFSDDELVQNLIDCSKLVNNLPIKLLKIPQSLEKLSELTNIIENDNKTLIF